MLFTGASSDISKTLIGVVQGERTAAKQSEELQLSEGPLPIHPNSQHQRGPAPDTIR